MIYKDRKSAAEILAERLREYAGRQDAVVVALPRGGLALGRVVADRLSLPLDIVVPRKIGMPGNPEYAIGALTETGEQVWNEPARRSADSAEVEATVRQETVEAQRRLGLYREGLPPRDFRGKTVLVVDDGIATGLTMSAALKTVRSEGAAKIVVAVPVAPPDALERLANETDETIILQTPVLFMSVGSFYDDFPQVSDKEAIRLLRPL